MRLQHSTIVMAAVVSLAGLPALAVESPRLTLDDAQVEQVMRTGTAREKEYAAKLTIYWENDGGWARPIDRTDRHYTAGVGASLAFQAPFVDDLLSHVPSFGNEFEAKKSDYAMGLVGALTIFTPENLREKGPITTDRPYAGWTYSGLFFQRANRSLDVPVYESLEADLGILGPSSLAENAQQMIHHAYHYIIPQGWDHQINDEPDFNIKYNRRWRLSLWAQDGHWPGMEVLPEVGATVGSLTDEAHAGGVFRLGWNLPDDFGPGHLSNPADFTWAAPCTCENWFEGFFTKQSFYFFARPYGEVVARNALLQGDTWHSHDPVTVTEEPGFFGVEYGLSQRVAKHFEVTYSWTSQSHEFEGQHNWDTWASVQFSFFMAW